MKYKLIFISILMVSFLILTTHVMAQTTNMENTAPINQLQILEKQVNILNQTNDKILNTIYWALGGLITVFLAIVGLNFFQNFSLNKSKLDSIKKEMFAELTTEKEKIESKLQTSFSDIQEQNKKELLEFNTKIDTKVKLSIETLLKEYQSKINKIQEDYEDVKRDNLIRKAFDHQKEGQMGYIINLIDALELDIKKNYDWRINESLDRISRCLDEGYKNNDSMSKLNAVLSKLPAEYSFQKKSIETKMSL